MKWACLTVVMLLAWLASGWAAADEAAANQQLDAKRIAELRRELEPAVRRYASARADLRSTCGRCGGAGVYTEIIAGVGGGQRRVPCGTCDRKGWRIDRKNFRLAFYDLKSPSWRVRASSQPEVEAAFRSAASSSQPPRNYRNYKVDSIEFADEAHAIARILYEGQLEERVAWIKAAEGNKKPAWWIYDDDADGPWPEPKPEPTPAAPGPGDEPLAKGDPLPPDLEEQLRKAFLAMQDRNHYLREARQSNGVLSLVLDVKSVPSGTNLDELALEDFRRIGGALWGLGDAEWRQVVWVMRAKYRDKFGALEPKPYMVARINKEDFLRIRWENLRHEERLPLFSPVWPEHEGWILWKQD